MYSVHPLELKTLSPEKRVALEALVEPEIRCCFDGIHPETFIHATIFAIEATFENQPVGLLLGSVLRGLQFGEVHALVVAKEHRHQHLATRMLNLAEQEYVKQECRILSLVYPDAPAQEAAILEKILKNQNWHPSKLTRIQCWFEIAKMNPPWLFHKASWLKEFEIFPWSELTEHDTALIKLHRKELVFPDWAYPLETKLPIEPINSLGMRYKGELVGWVITHRITPDTIQCRVLWVSHEWRKSGAAMKLMCEGIRRQKASSVPNLKFEINLRHIERDWLHLVKQKFFPYANRIVNLREAWKELGNRILGY